MDDGAGSVGQFVGLGEKTGFDWLVSLSRPHKVTNTYAIGETSSRNICLTRGTPTCIDDVKVQRGQAWLTVSSPIEGASHVTAFVPSVFGWDKRLQDATVYWVDADWTLPPPTVGASGSRQTLATTVTRHTNHCPVVGWHVRYEITGGPDAGFAPDGARIIEVVTDSLGQARAEIFQIQPAAAAVRPVSFEVERTAQLPVNSVPGTPLPGTPVNVPRTTAGTNTVSVQIIRPAEVPGSDGARLVVHTGETTKTWSSPDISLKKTGPAQASIGATVIYRIDVRNSGATTAKEVLLTEQLAPGLSFLSSQPPATANGNVLQWRLGDLQSGQASSVQVSFRADKAGTVNNCAHRAHRRRSDRAGLRRNNGHDAGTGRERKRPKPGDGRQPGNVFCHDHESQFRAGHWPDSCRSVRSRIETRRGRPRPDRTRLGRSATGSGPHDHDHAPGYCTRTAVQHGGRAGPRRPAAPAARLALPVLPPLRHRRLRHLLCRRS